ncbi:MAG TPA: indolepyruvate ferredoxin oxidoreductase family protein [Stellaceae bacterium]|nr:indolepyruvate ferredoxin oxidoreductase family protein [Stellaceae bacterium]
MLAAVTLDDKYTQERGRIYLSGIQALVRLPILQQQRDREAGLNTGGFISGYRGSPLGVYDNALWQARRFLERANIQFEPGLNEDLAATAVWGSQQTTLYPSATVDGVLGIWYGKGPGVDRSIDVLKHANSAGTARHGGVLAIAGDDHGCQSSTLAHQSEQDFIAAMIPVLNPATVQEYLDFGVLGFALSRFSGCWVGFKAIAETVESSASIAVDPHRIKIALPEDFVLPPGGLGIRWPDAPLEQEARLHGPKMAAVAAFARANALDRIVLDAPDARLGIITTGKAYLDTRQALSDLGIGEREAERLGIRLYKVGLTWPLEREGALRFASGLKDVLVVEEKRGLIEDQLMRLLYNLPADRRPSIIGKQDETGQVLLPSAGEINPTMVARALVGRLKRLDGERPELNQRLARLEALERLGDAPLPKTQRSPFFCSGCPHNTSTKVPEGSRALAGIGCHSMAIWMPSRHTSTISHMGGEGAGWIGQAAFTKDKHVFANLGDGTYAHSGLLAIRAASFAGVNITYKILYNDAVAMTGGQPPEGHMTVPQIAQQVAAEGAKRVVIVTDEPDKYPLGAGFPPGTQIQHRDTLDQVQRELRETKGLTVLIYDQTCAAEKRRRRKRGRYPDPPKRVFINDAVCEGCGDCSDQSNCVSVKPLETEFGRKRAIDQSNCNKDYSCLKGFCPSFVTVHGGSLRKLAPAPAEFDQARFTDLPEPTLRPLSEPYGVLVTGIGGTGVITVGQLLGMAAHLEGKGCSVLDFTGLAQKNGAVMSHIRLAARPEDINAVRIAAGGADLLLGCDMVVAASAPALTRIEHGVTRAVVNSYLAPTAAFVMNGDVDFEEAAMHRTLRNTVGGKGLDLVDGSGLATALLSDAIATNLFMLGYAWQKGLVPLSREAIERAIELNAVGVEMNKRAFAWGRLAAHDLGAVEAAARPVLPDAPKRAETVEEMIERRVAFLSEYQNQRYAQRYAGLAHAAAATEAAHAKGKQGFGEAVAQTLFRLMAYKDEYEVARLYTNGDFLRKLQAQFQGDYKLQFHLAPPLWAPRDPATGELQKQSYGAWVMPLFRVLARLKRLRGTKFDPFGYSAERRVERQLVGEYEAVVAKLMARLTAENHTLAVEIARLPQQIRGYGHVKERARERVKQRQAELLAAFLAPAPTATAAE